LDIRNSYVLPLCAYKPWCSVATQRLGSHSLPMPQRNDPHTHQREMKFAHGQVRSKQV
jgi:hypothetical protein